MSFNKIRVEKLDKSWSLIIFPKKAGVGQFDTFDSFVYKFYLSNKALKRLKDALEGVEVPVVIMNIEKAEGLLNTMTEAKRVIEEDAEIHLLQDELENYVPYINLKAWIETFGNYIKEASENLGNKAS